LSDTHGKFDDWEEIVVVRQPFEAEMITARLEEAGIEAAIVDQSFELVPLTHVSDYDLIRIVVPTARVEEARRVLSEIPALAEDAEVPASEPEVPTPETPVKE
jgi:putative signal transducing protein